jgi:hypothetical protein
MTTERGPPVPPFPVNLRIHEQEENMSTTTEQSTTCQVPGCEGSVVYNLWDYEEHYCEIHQRAIDADEVGTGA